ncbi:MAG: hypothetical protein CMJ19_21730 [Phycisphaeraceae bacterium]|nr:hypothetical protein [Phycisphaeraceae bacterium]
MKKIFKALVVIVVVVLLLIVIGVGILFSQINNIAKSGIERGGTYALGVPTTLGSIDIAIFSGECDLDNLNIANPDGFTYDNFMKIGHGEFALDTSTIRSDKVVVKKLHFDTVELSIEKTKTGANYQVILDNLQKTADSLKSGKEPAADEPTDDAASDTGFVIQDILIKNVKVNVNLDALGIGGEVKKTIELKDPIHLTNVGSAKDAGAQMSTVIAKLVQTMLAEIIRQGGGLLPPIISDELGKGLEGISAIGDIGTQIIGDTVGETLNQVGNVTEGVGKAAEGVTEEAGKAVEGTTKEIGKAADGLLKGVGGLLGGDKNKEEKSE